MSGMPSESRTNTREKKDQQKGNEGDSESCFFLGIASEDDSDPNCLCHTQTLGLEMDLNLKFASNLEASFN